MLQSKLFTRTLKEAPKDEKSVNAVLLQRAGFIFKEMAGAYTFLPLGLQVLGKIEKIIREEMEKAGGQEILMTVLQPRELWEKTNRWSEGIGKDIMYKCPQGEGEVGLGPTHEEMLTDIVSNYVKSYEDLPMMIFQIQTKFRKELRSKSGLLRGKEFGMKDFYSFHADEEDFKKYYEKMKKAYFSVFKRCGLKAVLTEASGAGFTEGFTHEFQVLSEDGEDSIIYCPKFDFSQNAEMGNLKAGEKCPKCGNILKEGKSIEVGNIFPLGTKYSEAMGALFQDKDGKKKPVVMGCYGIGTTRLVGTVVEVFHDEKGIVWPEEVSPFDIHLLALRSGDKKIDKKIKDICEKLCDEFEKAGKEVLYDDRAGKSAGEKLVESDLIGIYNRIVVSARTLEKDSVEAKKRSSNKAVLVKIKKAKLFINE